jgi:hypothetical protein
MLNKQAQKPWVRGQILRICLHDTENILCKIIDLSAAISNTTMSGFDAEDGGCFVARPNKDKIVITPRAYNKNEVSVETMHISSQSDTYQHNHDYGGVIIYQYNGKSEWKTANNTHCKSGYIVIQDSGSKNVKQWRNEPGAVHGAVYRNAFGESVNEAEVVGEGFALQNKKFKMCSGVFNNPHGSAFHDHRRRMHELSEHCVRKVVEYWKTAGLEGTFEVKALLKDFEFGSPQRHIV